MKQIYFLLLILIFNFNLYAAGETGGTVLELITTAKPASMAGVYIAKTDDVNAIFYNPAGLASINNYELGFTYDKNILDMINTIATFLAPINGIGSFGFGLIYSFIKDDINNVQEEKNVKVFELVGILSYSYPFTKEFLAGINFKYLNNTFGNYSAAAFMFDVGILYHLNKSISLGFVGQNIGTNLKYDREETKLPLKAGAGINYKILKIKEHIITIGSDLKYNIIENNIQGGIGLEYIYDDIFSVRAGYIIEQKSLNSLTFGGGIKSLIGDILVKLDYALLPKIWMEGSFDFEQIVSMTVTF